MPDIFLHDTQTGTTTRVSVDSLGNESDNASYYVGGISDDGRFISFHSTATNLVAGDTNGVDDIFLHDTQTGTTTRVSVDSLGGEATIILILVLFPTTVFMLLLLQLPQTLLQETQMDKQTFSFTTHKQEQQLEFR
ncbi:MAG: hypothetical protein R3B39_02875 [Candidatus Paceibacterota bacterium]